MHPRTLFKLIKSPINLPEGTSGKFSIVHGKGDKFDVVSSRESFLTGKKSSVVIFDEPIKVHKLTDQNGVWMTDVPIEVRQMRDAVKQLRPEGKVLVGGLGLGVVTTLLVNHPRVDKVVTIEKSVDVVALATRGQFVGEVIVADIYEWLATLPVWDFDCAFFDTWRGSNEGEWWYSVFPLRRIIANRFGKQRYQCWSEDIMLGQVMRKLTFADGVQFNPILKTPIEWKPHWFYRMETPFTWREAHWFVKNIGLPKWEEKYGELYPWSEFLKPEADD